MEQPIERQDVRGAGDAQTVREVSTPLFEAKGWMKFLGVLSIIQGIIMIFTVWGILICWLPIWIGVVLLRAGSAVEVAHTGASKTDMIVAMGKLRTYFTIQGILALIMIVAVVIMLIVAGGTIFALLASGARGL